MRMLDLSPAEQRCSSGEIRVNGNGVAGASRLRAPSLKVTSSDDVLRRSSLNVPGRQIANTLDRMIGDATNAQADSWISQPRVSVRMSHSPSMPADPASRPRCSRSAARAGGLAGSGAGRWNRHAAEAIPSDPSIPAADARPVLDRVLRDGVPSRAFRSRRPVRRPEALHAERVRRYGLHGLSDEYREPAAGGGAGDRQRPCRRPPIPGAAPMSSVIIPSASVVDRCRAGFAQTPHGLNQRPMSQAQRPLV
jgi:hypothetical protein